MGLIVPALADRGQHYEVVAVAPGFSLALPTALGYPVSLVMNDVILARTDIPARRFSLTNTQTGNYLARIRMVVNTPLGPQLVVIPRQ